jgi:tRNA threonylcarbamoyladenosine biosynthesis protein TsaB
MVTLVIETATAACSVALLEDKRVRAARHEVVGRGHAERLVPMVSEVLAEAGLDRVDGVLVDCGPGSFTGIRVGLAASRGLGFAWGVPVSGFSALALIAATATEAVGVALTGGHGELFVQRFAAAPLRAIGPMRSLAPAEAAAFVPDEVVLGSGAPALIAARGWGRAEDRLPDARDVLCLPEDQVALPPSPLYGRAPDARVPA